MELSEKIQKLRKERGLTQEQFAQQLFVSRTAVSKWETGRGVPSIESLQMIAKFFGISLDELLRTEEVITIAENENKENIGRFALFIDGILNAAAIMGLLLPLYKAEQNEMFYSVPLYRLDNWLAVLFWVFPVLMAICGTVQIIYIKSESEKLIRIFSVIGTVFNIGAVIVLILSSQPYPAILFFALLFLKVIVFFVRVRKTSPIKT